MKERVKRLLDLVLPDYTNLYDIDISFSLRQVTITFFKEVSGYFDNCAVTMYYWRTEKYLNKQEEEVSKFLKNKDITLEEIKDYCKN